MQTCGVDVVFLARHGTTEWHLAGRRPGQRELGSIAALNLNRTEGQRAPGPAEASTSPEQPELDGVACRSATVCAATGEYAPGGHSAYFLEEWSGGRWHLVGAPHPAGFPSGALNGVSCVPARCTAVGAWSGGPISIATLALAD